MALRKGNGMKPQIYPTRSLQEAAVSFPPPARQMDLFTPRNASERWSAEVRKDRKLLAWAFCYKPSAVGEWLARLAEAVDMAAVEAIWYRDAGWRK